MTIRRLATAYPRGSLSMIYEMPLLWFASHPDKQHHKQSLYVTAIKIAKLVKLANGKKWNKIEKSQVIYNMPYEHCVKEIVNDCRDIVVFENMIYNQKDLHKKTYTAKISDETDDY